MRAAREDLPPHREDDLPALPQPEWVMAVGTGTGAHCHPGGQGASLDPDVTQRAGLPRRLGRSTGHPGLASTTPEMSMVEPEG